MHRCGDVAHRFAYSTGNEKNALTAENLSDTITRFDVITAILNTVVVSK